MGSVIATVQGQLNPADLGPILRDLLPPAEPPLDPAAIAAYLDIVHAECGRAETRPYRKLSELRGAPPASPSWTKASTAASTCPCASTCTPCARAWS